MLDGKMSPSRSVWSMLFAHGRIAVTTSSDLVTYGKAVQGGSANQQVPVHSVLSQVGTFRQEDVTQKQKPFI